MSQFVLGLLVVMAASVFQGCFMVPMSYVKGWKWENSWAVFCILAMVLFNWIFAVSTVPALSDIYSTASAKELFTPATFGLLWGIGAVCFGLGIAAVGFALGYSVIMGLVLTLGAVIPMALGQGEQFFKARGLVVLAGLGVMLVGIVVFGMAGVRKETEQGQRSGQITQFSKASMKLGLLICIAAGVFSCFSNVGLDRGRPLIEIAKQLQTPEKWASNPVFALVFTAGAVANLIYCGYLFVKNRSFREYANPGFLKNFILMALVSLMWIGSFIIYGAGAEKMGDWGTIIGWSVFIALSITIANGWGFAQGEWANTSPKTRRLLAAGLGTLVLAIAIIACSNTRLVS